MKEFRKANKALWGGAMTMNTAQMLKPGANASTAMSTLEGSIGIGLVGGVSNKMFDLMETKKKRRR
ncbi:MAG: hypothetical protein H7836_10765 [Magnetococcus sp. YQC-3]